MSRPSPSNSSYPPSQISFLPRQYPGNVSTDTSYGVSQGFNSKLIQLLSTTSGYYGALWPEIIREAGWVERFTTLRFVNHFFEQVCKELEGHRRSERAKRRHIRWLGNKRQRPEVPFTISPSLYNEEWRIWGASSPRFVRIEYFVQFCELGGIDPSSGVLWEPHRPWVRGHHSYMWASPNRDIIVEARRNPAENNGYCVDIGVIGVESKAVAMFEYLRDGMHESGQPKHPESITEWSEMAWAREWI